MHSELLLLDNWRRHGEDRRFPTRKVDPCSSGISFAGWREREDAPLLFKPPLGHIPLSVSLPHTWLLRIGWKRAGTISFWPVPGPREKRELFGR